MDQNEEDRRAAARQEDARDAGQEPGRAEDERELPVAAVPPGVPIEDVEPADGFRLPEDQNEAAMAREQAEREARDASRPEVAQRLADEAQEHADKAAEHAQEARTRAEQIRDSWTGPDRPPLDEGWRYRKPEPDPHDPVG